jgi:glycosyltransferase involved in cell wall biosynthesis
MKILIVNFSDLDGGAAKAAYRLHRSLLKEGVDSKMLVEIKSSDDYTVIAPESNFDKFIAKSKAIVNIYPVRNKRNKAPFSPSFVPSFNTIKRINELDPDIVHLHWINAGMIKIEDLMKIKAPIVWSMHDMWPFTGGCHYAGSCEGYMSHCGNCFVLNSKKKNDFSRKLFNRKRKILDKIPNITFVGLSKWMTECGKNSSLLGNKKIINIPNTIDTTEFKLFDKQKSRDLWGLPRDKRIILFGAMKSTSDPRKGFSELCNSLSKINTKNVELLVYGSSKPRNSDDFGFNIRYIGQLHDNISLTTLYNTADVMIVPSLQENLSNVIIECLACGTPVVGFNIGGNSDMINHKLNGYLAAANDTEDLAKGIDWVLNNNDYDQLCSNAITKIKEDFSPKVVTKRYLDLYRSILNS